MPFFFLCSVLLFSCINLNAESLVSAVGTTEFPCCRGVVCPEHFLEARLEYVIAARADILHALIIEYRYPYAECDTDRQTDGEEWPPYALKDAKDECACLGDFGDDAYDDHSPSHMVKILFVFHLFCHIPQ